MFSTDFSHFNEDFELIRYMSLSKFMDIVLNRSLTFARIDTLPDQHEGLYLSKDEAWEQAYTDSLRFDRFWKLRNLPRSQPHDPRRNWLTITEAERTSNFVSCWTAADRENYALWKIYVPENEGVAIKTTVQALRKSLKLDQKNKLRAGRVTYLSREDILQLFSHIRFNPLFNKRKEYTYEDEFRIIYQHPGESSMRPEITKMVFKDLSFINGIIISPFARPWLADVIEKFLRQNELDTKIVSSEIKELL